MSARDFAELITATNFSFLRGASHAAELVARAKDLGLTTLGIADRNSFAGVVRAHTAAKEAGLRVLSGVRLVTDCGFEAATYPKTRAAYARLTRLLTQGNLRSEKGNCRFSFDELLSAAEGQIFIVVAPALLTNTRFLGNLARLEAEAPNRCYLAASHHFTGQDAERLEELERLAARFGTPLIATNDVLYHDICRRPLADILACIRYGTTLSEAGFRLDANGERHLKSPAEMARLFSAHPDAIARSARIAAEITFSLDELSYEYPNEPVPEGLTPDEHLASLAWTHAAERYPAGIPPAIRTQIENELLLIARLDYARYFLTVYDIVAFARSRGILCQGRGSAANSAVCYMLGITSVDPSKFDLLFERFISLERREPPDIDVDFEHERREEVIQYLYTRYGRARAAICSTVIHYRARMAIREVGKVLGLKEDVTGALANTVWGTSSGTIPDAQIRDAGLDPGNPAIRQAILLAAELTGFPRHLSQHVGGFVLTRERLDETVPILNGAMEDRTFIEWDKDDIDALGILKVDILALGMLSAIRKSFDLIEQTYGRKLTLASVPQEDPSVYEMLSRADSIGVFQVESRAQMSMLPRLKPREFYDLVIEVAIVRPGPIQGDMVHPYLRRRAGLDPIEFPSEELRSVLGKTCGVPLFQEQAMKIAIVAAGFSPGEADKLRRAMATFRHMGTIHTFREKFVTGMVSRGYKQDFAERCFRQIEGFGEYGFPESHAASFALLVYVSAWLKHHYPEAFTGALINAQPMGFYQPAQLVRDARQHGVIVREASINHSDWDCTLEPHALDQSPKSRAALRLGLRLISGLEEHDARTIVRARGSGYASVFDVAERSSTHASTLERLADADTFRALGLDRRQALWAVRGLEREKRRRRAETLTLREHDLFCEEPTVMGPPLLAHPRENLFAEPRVALPAMSASEHVAEDYTTTGLSLKAHPVSFFRDDLRTRGVITSEAHWDMKHAGRFVSVAGLVLVRQQPGTAKGVIFLTLEDEMGAINIIVWPKMFAKYRRIVMSSQFLLVRGKLEREGLIAHVVANELIDLSPRLMELSEGALRLPRVPADPGPNPDGGRGKHPTEFAQKSRDFH